MSYFQRAKNWITDHDVKQKKLADAFEVSESMFSKYLTGHTDIPVKVLVDIAKYFNISMDYLVELTDQPELPLKLSNTEREVVQRYRTLSRDQKELLLQTIRLMQEQNKR